MKRLYLSGPMSHKRAFNIPEFDKWAHNLRSKGYEVVSPAELDDPKFRELCLQCKDGTMEELAKLCEAAGIKPDTWGDLLARDVKLLADDGIEGIVVLKGWEGSRGATLETYVGRLCGLPILYAHGLAPVPEVVLEMVHGRAAKPTQQPPRLEDVVRDFPPLENPVSREDAQAGLIPVSSTGGRKEVKSNVKGDLCPKAMQQLGEVCGFGRKKYDRGNYLKGFPFSSSYDAAQRHLEEFWQGKETDDESGLHPLAHAAWQCLAMLAFVLRGVGEDDRL